MEHCSIGIFYRKEVVALNQASHSDKKPTGIAGFCWHALAGASIGVLNGLFGAGGGIVAVSFLRKLDGDVKTAHATAILITLFLSLASSYLYVTGGAVTLSDALPYLPGGVIGAVAGALLLRKISDFWLRKVFAVFILYSAIRLLLR